MLYELRKSHPNVPPDGSDINADNAPWDTFYTSKNTRVLEIVLGNTCDSKCIYCSDYFSSLWAAEKRKYGEDVYLTWENDFDSPLVKTFWEYFEEAWPTLPHVNFIGGEPLIIKDFFRYLDKMLEIGDRMSLILDQTTIDKKGLSIVTNGNTPSHLLERFLEYSKKLSKYFNIHVQISGENTEEQLEYVRFGTEWAQWKENVEKYMTCSHIEVQFLPAVQLVTIPSMKNYIDFVREIFLKYKKPIKLNWASVDWPKEFNLDFIPLEVIPHIDDCLTSLRLFQVVSIDEWQIKSIQYFIRSLQKVKDLSIEQNLNMVNNPTWGKNFVAFFDKLDQRRGTTWYKTFPEFAKLKELTYV
jgi:organic radical activating enzyme